MRTMASEITVGVVLKVKTLSMKLSLVGAKTKALYPLLCMGYIASSHVADTPLCMYADSVCSM